MYLSHSDEMLLVKLCKLCSVPIRDSLSSILL